jgi:hypothetical protein
MSFRQRRQAIPCQDSSHPWGIALVHFVDAQHEDDWEVLLMRKCREEGMFSVARPLPFTEDRAEISPICRSAVRKRLQIAPCCPEIGDATGDDLRAQRACRF